MYKVSSADQGAATASTPEKGHKRVRCPLDIHTSVRGLPTPARGELVHPLLRRRPTRGFPRRRHESVFLHGAESPVNAAALDGFTRYGSQVVRQAPAVARSTLQQHQQQPSSRNYPHGPASVEHGMRNQIAAVGPLDDVIVVALAFRWAARRVPRDVLLEAWPAEERILARLLAERA